MNATGGAASVADRCYQRTFTILQPTTIRYERRFRDERRPKEDLYKATGIRTEFERKARKKKGGGGGGFGWISIY